MLRWRAIDISNFRSKEDPRWLILTRRVGNNFQTGKWAVVLETSENGVDWEVVPTVGLVETE